MDEGGLIMTEYRGFGRAYPPGRRQVVGAAWQATDHEKYQFLSDSICVISGEGEGPVTASRSTRAEGRSIGVRRGGAGLAGATRMSSQRQSLPRLEGTIN
jgi:hypothetical protein